MVVISEDVLQRILQEPPPPFTGHAGAIVRIALKDFMTYHKAELIPGAHINLILGPNGTGKSTIVNAICLGLNGKPQLLGRSNLLKDFIRHDCKSAYIEIELFNPTGNNYVIRRSLKVESPSDQAVTSNWYINGRHVRTSDVEEMLAKLNIQLDNLCQFLPQDRIEEFSKLDPYTLLISTEKAIGNDTLFNQHEDLIKLNSKIETLDYNLKMTVKSLSSDLQYTKNMESDVHCFEERERVILRIAELNSMKVWIMFLQDVEVFSNVQAEFHKITEQKMKEENSIAPLKAVVGTLESKLAKFKQEVSRTRIANDNTKALIKKQYDDALDEIASDVSDVQSNLEAEENTEKDRISRLSNAIQKVSSIKAEITQTGGIDETSLLAQIQEIEKRNMQISNQIFEGKGREKSDEMEKAEIKAKERHVKAELQQLSDWRRGRMRFLYSRNRDVHQAVEFFMNPDNVVGLNGRLYEPMLLHLNVKDYKFGKILERHVALSHMYAFFVDNPNDMKIVYRLVEPLNLRISVIYHEPKSSGLPPSKYSRDFLKRFKFIGVLSDIVEAEHYYLTYLCRRYNAHDVPVGDDGTDAISSVIAKETDLTTYYTQKWAYRNTKSSYSGNRNSAVNHLTPARVFTDQINVTERSGLEAELVTLQQIIEEIDRRMKSYIPEMTSLYAQRKLEEDKIKALQNKIQYWRGLETKLVTAEKAVQIYERKKTDLPALREEARKKINGYNVTSAKASVRITKQTGDITAQSIKLLALKRQIAATQSCIIGCQNQMEDAQNNIRTYTNQAKLLDDELKKAAHVAERRQKEAHATSAEPPKPVTDKIVNLTDIEKELRLSNVQLGMLSDTDPGIIAEYNKRMKRIEELTRKKDAQELDLANFKVEMATKQEEWLTPLQELIKRISVNFGRFFAQMKYGGQVELSIPDNPMQYDKYGMKILVKFRSNDSLTELTGYKQSGGERAISTAMYVLSLQELTTVPFRVIDEINQGMDIRNEGLFFRFLSQLAEGPKTPQYFLLTPKTLPTTEFGDNICFHVIFNGPYVEVPMKDLEKPKRSSSSKKRKAQEGESSKR